MARTAQDYKGTVETSLQAMGLRLTCLEEEQHGHVVLCVGRGHGERLLLVPICLLAPSGDVSDGCPKAKVEPVGTGYSRQQSPREV